MAYTEDVTVFFNAHAPGVSAATYDGATTIYGNFDQPDLGQLGIAGSNPTFVCAAADVAADPTNKTLVIGSVTYRIRDIRPQDDGAIVLLQLEQQ